MCISTNINPNLTNSKKEQILRSLQKTQISPTIQQHKRDHKLHEPYHLKYHELCHTSAKTAAPSPPTSAHYRWYPWSSVGANVRFFF